ncbi:MAG: UvrD-helicase domain-containing protein [Endomicrobium sp.]|jgi:ATP-dependent exoDNAse (exonuclease V) beta subunit|nr:UvrD-helicase domain-containing protein [Endomicrobium sp.]
MSFTQIICLKASAGSGKTYNLAKRYISLLLNHEDLSIKNLVAITFTNKAAIEMKTRIVSYLKMIALGMDTGNFLNEIKLNKKNIITKSKFLLNDIFNNYDSFNISTVDSFKNHILKTCAMNMDLSPNFEIKRDYSYNLLFALENFLKKAKYSYNSSENKIILKYLLQYLTRDLDWIPKNNIYSEIEKVFSKLSNIGKDVVMNDKLYFRRELTIKFNSINNRLKHNLNFFLNAGVNTSYIKAIKKILNEGVKSLISNYTPVLLANKNIKYKHGFKSNIKANNLWTSLNKELEDFYDFYMESYYNVYVNIYFKVISELNKQSKKESIIFLNEINKRTLDFFDKNNNVVPEIYYKLSNRYKHFLIDEFQDMSFIQWIGIKKFLEESLANGGSLFYVGDVKQAIYAFRYSDAKIFSLAKKEFPSILCKTKYLKYNFRSSKSIIDFNNLIFSEQNIKKFLFSIEDEEYIQYNLKDYIECYAVDNQQMYKIDNKLGYVEMYMIDNECKDVNIEIKGKLVKNIKQILQRFRNQDVAILCRKNEEIVKINSWLLENNLEVDSPQTLNIKNNTIIKQIVSLLMFINSQNNTLSFISFILGSIFEKVTNISSVIFEQFLFNFKGADSNKKPLWQIFMNKYKHLWNKHFAFFINKANILPVYELTIMILEKFEVIYNFKNSTIFISRFLELIKNFEEKFPGFGLYGFLDYFNSLKNHDDSLFISNIFKNGIKIMTIHKAKGLQFPVVIIPFLKFSYKAIEKPYFDCSDIKVRLLNINKNISKFSSKAKNIYLKARLESLLSEINVLYVSMTRAQYELYATIPPKDGISKNLSKQLFLEKQLVFGSNKINYKKHVKKIKNSELFIDRIGFNYKNQSYVKKLLIKKMFNIELKNNTEQEESLIMHYTLSKIKIANIKNMFDNINQIIDFISKKFYFKDTKFLKNRIFHLFKYNEIINLFISKECHVYNEREIIDSLGDTYIIDKLIIYLNKILIVNFIPDYNKNNKHNYKYYISKIYPNKKIDVYNINVINCKYNIENYK